MSDQEKIFSPKRPEESQEMIKIEVEPSFSPQREVGVDWKEESRLARPVERVGMILDSLDSRFRGNDRGRA